MRLIDADEFTRIVDSQELMEHLIRVGTKNSQNLSFALVQVIDNRPTAYDIDKVVAELEKLSKEYNAGLRLHGKPEEMCTDEAIKIVKQGGVRKDVE